MYAALLTLFSLSAEGFPTCNHGCYIVRWWLYLITKLVRGLSVLLLFIILLRIHNMNSFRNGLNMILFLLQVGSFLCLVVQGGDISSGFTGKHGFNHGCSSFLGPFGTKVVAWLRTVTLGVSVYLLLRFVI